MLSLFFCLWSKVHAWSLGNLCSAQKRPSHSHSNPRTPTLRLQHPQRFVFFFFEVVVLGSVASSALVLADVFVGVNRSVGGIGDAVCCLVSWGGRIAVAGVTSAGFGSGLELVLAALRFL